MTKEEALKILRYEMQTHIASEVELHIAMGIAIEALSADRWIPCSERLPKEKELVLACFRTYNGPFEYEIDVTYRVDYNLWHCKGRFSKADVAWMPLPKPYKKSDERPCTVASANVESYEESY